MDQPPTAGRPTQLGKQFNMKRLTKWRGQKIPLPFSGTDATPPTRSRTSSTKRFRSLETSSIEADGQIRWEEETSPHQEHIHPSRPRLQSGSATESPFERAKSAGIFVPGR